MKVIFNEKVAKYAYLPIFDSSDGKLAGNSSYYIKR
jgi:hypothetical protein